VRLANAFSYLKDLRFWHRLLVEIRKDDCFGMAAQLSYYLLLAFFPFLLFLSALVGVMPGWGNLVGGLVDGLEYVLPETAWELTNRTVTDLQARQDQGVLTVGLALTLYFASLAFYGMSGVLNRAYRMEETRSLPRLMAVSLGSMIVVSVFVLAAAALIFFGDNFARIMIDERMWGLRMIYSLARWALIVVFLNFGLQLLYFLIPAQRLPWRLVSPGSVIATTGFVVSSLAFRAYVNAFPTYQKLYGTLGSLMALMLWFYMGSLFLLAGGVADSEIFRQENDRFTQ